MNEYTYDTRAVNIGAYFHGLEDDLRAAGCEDVIIRLASCRVHVLAETDRAPFDGVAARYGAVPLLTEDDPTPF